MKAAVKRVVRSGAKRLLTTVDQLWPAPPAGIVVLIYHRVGGGSDSAVDLPVDVFRQQVAHLAEHHRVLGLADAVAELGRGAAKPQPGVVITFDDGAADFAEIAAPILVEAGLHSTLYLVTSAPDVGELPWGVPASSWHALRDLHQTGLVGIESHTHDHRVMHRVSAETAEAQLQQSVDLISEHIGTPPEHFAYPKAVPGNRAARAAVAARFRSAALAGHRVNTDHSSLQRLGRVPLSRGDSFDDFVAKVGGAHRAEGFARHVTARARYWNATT